MSSSGPEYHPDEPWKEGIFRRVRRMECIILIIAVLYNDFIPNQIFTNPKNKPVDSSDVSEIKDAISSLREIQDMMEEKMKAEASQHISMIREMNDKITQLTQNERKFTDMKAFEVNTGIQMGVSAPIDNIQSQKMESFFPSTPIKIVHNVSNKTKTVEDLHHRKLQSDKPKCVGYNFILKKKVFLAGLRFELFNKRTETTVTLHDDPAVDIITACIESAPYRFTIHDDRLLILEEKDPLEYDIYIDDLMIVDGGVFFRKTEHNFDTSKECFVDSLISITIKDNNITEARLKGSLRDAYSETVFNLETNGDPAQSYYSCIAAGTYIFDISNTDDIMTSCLKSFDCFRISINNKLLVRGKDFIENSSKRFYITKSGEARIISEPSNYCQLLPTLSPKNFFNNFIFDETMSMKIQILQPLSSKDALDLFSSPQYKAACWTLYDDPFITSRDDKLFIERYVLAVLFWSTKQTDAINNPMATCDYQGIQCNDEGYVAQIHWINSIQDGTIPSELTHLRSLESLALSKFKLSGTLPPQYARLTKLKEVFLSQNSITGTIPTSFGKMTDIEVLRLDDNFISGTIPSELALCSQLKAIDLNENRLSGTLPTEISLLHQLSRFGINRNNLSGTIPSQFGLLSKLFFFSADQNRLIGTIPEEFAHLDSLESLTLSNNELSGTIPDIFENLSALWAVDLSNNKLIGSFPSSLKDLNLKKNHPHQLYALFFGGNNLEGTIADEFCELSTLQFMGIDFPNIRVDDSTWFRDAPKVTCDCCNAATCSIWLADTELVGGTKRPICSESNLHYISYKTYGGAIDRINDSIFFEIGLGTRPLCLSPTGCYTIFQDPGYHSDSPIFYDLSYSASSKSLVQHQSSCDAVELCGFSFNKDHTKRKGLNHLTQIVFTDLNTLEDEASPAYQALCWIMTKDTLYIEHAICEGTLLQRFVLMLFYLTYEYNPKMDLTITHTCEWAGVKCDDANVFVEEFNLSNKSLKGTLVTELGLLTRLKKLDLSDNKLRGTIDPSIFKSLVDLEVLNLKNNSFDGVIPDELLMLPKLKHFSLSKNNFVHELPDSFDYPKTLEFLDVSQNLLKTKIPQAMFGCKNLEVFNISRNNVIGTISPAFGDLKKLKKLHLNENNLSGSLPKEIFSLPLEIFMANANRLTSSIPTEIGLLQKATNVSLNHNTLYGYIPHQIKNMKSLQLLHLHSNVLQGDSPDMVFSEKDDFTYITDCGKPSYASDPVKCDSCTMCCNANGDCQKKTDRYVPLWLEGLLYALIVPGGIVIIGLSDRNKLVYNRMFAHRSISNIYTDDSVYSFIFSQHHAAKFAYFLTLCIQIGMFSLYLRASNFKSKFSDWQYSFHCPNNSIQCADQSMVNKTGWSLYVGVTVLYLGSDLVVSILQLCKGVVLKEGRMFFSGFVLYYLTALAAITSGFYNLALAQKDTDLIMNAVILFFINDMDEQLFFLLQRIAPIWTDDRVAEVEAALYAKFAPTIRRESVYSRSSNNVNLDISSEPQENKVIPVTVTTPESPPPESPPKSHHDSAPSTDNTSIFENYIWAW